MVSLNSINLNADNEIKMLPTSTINPVQRARTLRRDVVVADFDDDDDDDDAT